MKSDVCRANECRLSQWIDIIVLWHERNQAQQHETSDSDNLYMHAIYFYKPILIYFYSRVSYRRVFICDFTILNNFDKILVGLGRVIRKVKTSKRSAVYNVVVVNVEEGYQI